MAGADEHVYAGALQQQTIKKGKNEASLTKSTGRTRNIKNLKTGTIRLKNDPKMVSEL